MIRMNKFGCNSLRVCAAFYTAVFNTKESIAAISIGIAAVGDGNIGALTCGRVTNILGTNILIITISVARTAADD